MWKFVRDIGSFLAAVSREFKALLGILGLTLLRFWTPIFGKNIPNSVFWLGVGGCLFLAFFLAWRREHNKILLVALFIESLKVRCDNAVLGWEELAEQYQNMPKGRGQPRTLQEPMAPWWGSSELRFLPFKIGKQQAATIALLQDLKQASVCVQEFDPRISLPQLLNILRKYKEELDRLR